MRSASSHASGESHATTREYEPPGSSGAQEFPVDARMTRDGWRFVTTTATDSSVMLLGEGREPCVATIGLAERDTADEKPR